MKVVFIVTSFWSYGELLIAMQFANELRYTSSKVLFIIPPTHKNNVAKNNFKYVSLIPKSQKLNRLIFSEVEHTFKPELIILSDFLNYSFSDRHYGIDYNDLSIFSGKLATFDNFNWSLERKCMDTYGFVSDIPKRTDVKYYGEKILPCPLVDAKYSSEGSEYHYSLVRNRLDTSKETRRLLRSKYGFSNEDNNKIILASYAKWQDSYISHENIGDFINLSNSIFDELILQLSKYYTIICIGKQDVKFKDNKNIHCYNSMPEHLFDEYASLSDLYIGRNMTSTSMVKLALSDIICINIINSIVTNDKISETCIGDLDYGAMISNMPMYKYMMFPVGWYYFLKPLFWQNLYADIICLREQFHMNETLHIIHELLFSQIKKESISDKVHELNKQLTMLPTPIDIVESIISK